MRRRFLLPLLAIWSGLLLSASTAFAGEPAFPPGLRIGLAPPAGFTLSRHFSGFEDADRKAAIVILDLPALAYPELQRSAFAQERNGLTGLKRESFPFANGIGLLITGTTNEGGGPIHKWFLLATSVGGAVPDLTMLVTVQVPDAVYATYSDAVVRAALASVTFRPAPIKEQLGLLPFKISDLAGFRVVQVLAAGGIIITDGPTDDITTQPYMIVSIGPGAPEPGDRGRFVNDMLATAPLRDLRVQLSEPQRINGGPGYEIRAKATGPRGDAVSLVQWVRFGGSGYMRVIGVSKTENWDAMFTRFRAVRDGIESR